MHFGSHSSKTYAHITADHLDMGDFQIFGTISGARIRYCGIFREEPIGRETAKLFANHASDDNGEWEGSHAFSAQDPGVF